MLQYSTTQQYSQTNVTIPHYTTVQKDKCYKLTILYFTTQQYSQTVPHSLTVQKSHTIPTSTTVLPHNRVQRHKTTLPSASNIENNGSFKGRERYKSPGRRVPSFTSEMANLTACRTSATWASCASAAQKM